MAAAKGNQYAAHSKRWLMAIERALEKRSRIEQVEALDELAEQLLQQCAKGDLSALRELGDRLDGKPHQTVEAKIDNTGTITHEHRSVQEIDGRIADLYAGRQVVDNSPTLPN